LKINQLVEAKYVGQNSVERILKKFFVQTDGTEVWTDWEAEEIAHDMGQVWKLNDRLIGQVYDSDIHRNPERFHVICVKEENRQLFFDLYEIDGDEVWSDLRENDVFQHVKIFVQPEQVFP
jgi:hypothetical protein